MTLDEMIKELCTYNIVEDSPDGLQVFLSKRQADAIIAALNAGYLCFQDTCVFAAQRAIQENCEFISTKGMLAWKNAVLQSEPLELKIGETYLDPSGREVRIICVDRLTTSSFPVLGLYIDSERDDFETMLHLTKDGCIEPNNPLTRLRNKE